MTDRQASDNHDAEVSEERLNRIEADDVDIEEELAVDELSDTHHILDETLKASFPASDPPSWTSSGI